MTQVAVRLVQMEVRPGRPRENTQVILRHIAQARQDGIELVVFPELVIPGYLIGDEWERAAFLRECEACGEEIREAARGLVVVFGNVAVDWHKRNEDGRPRKYNALFVAEEGQFLGPAGSQLPYVVKTLQPNYREFDESRHFTDTRRLALERGCDVRDLIAPVHTRRLALGGLLCEDVWDADYALAPLRILAQKGAKLLVNASASPFTQNKNQKRCRLLSAAARTVDRPLLYVNNTGIQNNGKTVFTFDGGTAIYDGAGNWVPGPPPFTEGVLDRVVALEQGGWGAPVQLTDDGIPALCGAVLYGTRKFMELCGVERVVVGVSGGIDSAVAAALYRHLLPPERLLLVSLPSRHNSPTTIGLARTVARNLGCGYLEIPIDPGVELTARQMREATIQGGPAGAPQRLQLTEFHLENVQARDRGARLLAAVAAAFGGVFTCNANKSELTVGYSTFYGDLSGFFANLADLWKGEVYELARHLNTAVYEREVIPAGCFAVTPSAELSPAQAVDEGRGDPLVYPYHDALFRSWVEWWNRVTPEEILGWYAAGTLEERLGYAGRVADLFPTAADFIADLERWWNQYQGLAVAKRIQAPPVLALKRRAFGFDHREALLGARYTARYEALKRELLGSG